MILETKQVLFRAHVHSLDHRSRNVHDHFEQTIPAHAYEMVIITVCVYSDLRQLGCLWEFIEISHL